MPDMDSLLEDLRAGRRGGFWHMDREQTYASLGIRKASELDSHEIGGLNEDEIEEVARLVEELALSLLPILYPSDQRYLEFFEGMRIPGQIQDLRDDLGHFHYFTRNSILARLRGSLFADLLHIYELRRHEVDLQKELVISALQYLAPNLDRYAAKVRDVLTFSIHDHLEPEEAEILVDGVLELIAGFFLSEPRAYLDAPDRPNYWSQCVRESEGHSLAARTLRNPIGNLEVIFNWWDRKLGDKKISENLEGGYRFLIDSRWYRYFWHSEAGLERHMRQGGTGFQETEVFDDFAEKLALLDTWKYVELPSGAREDDAARVRSARELGNYAVHFTDGTKFRVEVILLAGIGLEELRRRVREGNLVLSPHVHLFATREDRDSCLVSRSGESRLERAPFFKLGGAHIALLRLPRPGRYEVLDMETGEQLGVVERSEPHVQSPEILVNPLEGTLEVRASIEARLADAPADPDLEWAVEAPTEPGSIVTGCCLVDAGFGVYSIEMRALWELSGPLYGAKIALSSPLLPDSVETVVPPELLAVRDRTRFRLLDYRTTADQSREYEFFLLGDHPLEIQVGDDERQVILPGTSGRAAGQSWKVEWTELGKGRSRLLITNEGLARFFLFQGQRRYQVLIRSDLQLRFASPLHSFEGHTHFAPLDPGLAFAVTGEDRLTEIRVQIEAPDGRLEEITTGLNKQERVPFIDGPAGRYLYTVARADGDLQTFIVYHLHPPIFEIPDILEKRVTSRARVRAEYPLIVESATAEGCQVTLSPGSGFPSEEFAVSLEPEREAPEVTELKLAFYPAEIRSGGVVRARWPIRIVDVEFLVAQQAVEERVVAGYAGEPVSVKAAGLPPDATLTAVVNNQRLRIAGGGSQGGTIPLPEPGEGPIKIQLAAIVEGAEVLLRSFLLLHREFIPTVLLPDGGWYIPGEPFPVLVSPPREGLVLRLESADGEADDLPVPAHGLVWVTARSERSRLALRQNRGGWLRLIYGNVREAIDLQALNRDSAVPSLFAPDASDAWVPMKTLPVSEASEIASLVTELFKSFQVVGVYLPSFTARIGLFRELGDRGVELFTTKPSLAPIRFSDPSLKPHVVHYHHTCEKVANPRCVFVDSRESSCILNMLTKSRSRWIVILNNSIVRIGEAEDWMVRKISEAIIEGRMQSLSDFDVIEEELSASEQTMFDAVCMRKGQERLVADAIFSMLEDPGVTADENTCQTIASLLSSPQLLPLSSGESSAKVLARVSAAVENMMDLPDQDFETRLRGTQTLISGLAKSDESLNLQHAIERKLIPQMLEAKRREEWEDVFLILGRLGQLFPNEVRYLVEEAAFHYELALQAQDGEHRRQMVQLITKARSLSDDLGQLMRRYPDIYVRHILATEYHECGEIIWVTRDICPRCGKPYSAADR